MITAFTTTNIKLSHRSNNHDDSVGNVPIRSRRFALPSTTQEESIVEHDESTTRQDKQQQQSQQKKWFPRRPEDALFQEYDTLVKGAYVRHVLLETKEMTELAIQMYLKGGEKRTKEEMEEQTVSDLDPFSKLAMDLSACELSREEGGKIGKRNRFM